MMSYSSRGDISRQSQDQPTETLPSNYYDDFLMLSFLNDDQMLMSSDAVKESLGTQYKNENFLIIAKNEPEHQQKQKRKKTGDFMSSIGSFSDQKQSSDAAFKIYKSLFTRDIRRAYPRLLQDAVNTTNFRFLKNVLNRMCIKDCKLQQCQIQSSFLHNNTNEILLGPSQHEYYNRDVISQYMTGLCLSMPDLLFHIQDFKLRQMSHIPRSFDGIPLELILNSDPVILDTYMSQVAAYERVEPTRGFVLVGKYLMSGTRVSDVQVIAKSDDAVLDVSNDVLSSFKSVLNGNFIQDQTKVPVSPNVHYFGYFIWILNNDNKIIRMEFHADTLKVTTGINVSSTSCSSSIFPVSGSRTALSVPYVLSSNSESSTVVPVGVPKLTTFTGELTTASSNNSFINFNLHPLEGIVTILA